MGGRERERVEQGRERGESFRTGRGDRACFSIEREAGERELQHREMGRRERPAALGEEKERERAPAALGEEKEESERERERALEQGNRTVLACFRGESRVPSPRVFYACPRFLCLPTALVSMLAHSILARAFYAFPAFSSLGESR